MLPSSRPSLWWYRVLLWKLSIIRRKFINNFISFILYWNNQVPLEVFTWLWASNWLAFIKTFIALAITWLRKTRERAFILFTRSLRSLCIQLILTLFPYSWNKFLKDRVLFKKELRDFKPFQVYCQPKCYQYFIFELSRIQNLSYICKIIFQLLNLFIIDELKPGVL